MCTGKIYLTNQLFVPQSVGGIQSFGWMELVGPPVASPHRGMSCSPGHSQCRRGLTCLTLLCLESVSAVLAAGALGRKPRGAEPCTENREGVAAAPRPVWAACHGSGLAGPSGPGAPHHDHPPSAPISQVRAPGAPEQRPSGLHSPCPSRA